MLNTDKGLVMKAVIISDDFDFAAKACSTLRRVGRQAPINVQWAVKCWQASALEEAAPREKALSETLDAHLIVLQPHHVRSLPRWLNHWLQQWAALRTVRDAALGITGDRCARDGASFVCPKLSALIRQYHLKVIVDVAAFAKDESNLFVHFSSEQEIALPLRRLRFASFVAPDRYQSWGIHGSDNYT